ncbi:unnamed protein product [Prorocentrum cordatum]|uniref:Uncharacterized protein n=1 Tax=Prorocentrum cordatum TaxID=2364126 RepID=A0ABN9U9Z0_9DINO|nr:unnamed protein product [Polarella glacialis]
MEFAFVDRGDHAGFDAAAWRLLGKKQAMRIAEGESEIWITLGVRYHKKFWRFNAALPPAPGVVTRLPVDFRMPRVLTRCVDAIAVDVELLFADVERDEAFLKISNANTRAVLVDCLAVPLSSTVQMATGGSNRHRSSLEVKRQMRQELTAPEYQAISWEGINDAPSRQHVKISTVFGYKRPRVIPQRVDPIAVDVELPDAIPELDEVFLMISNANDGAVLVDCLAAQLSSTVQMVKRHMREELSLSQCQGITWEGINDAPSRQNVKMSTVFGYKRPRVLQ